jgi:hypothetical protein
MSEKQKFDLFTESVKSLIRKIKKHEVPPKVLAELVARYDPYEQVAPEKRPHVQEILDEAKRKQEELQAADGDKFWRPKEIEEKEQEDTIPSKNEKRPTEEKLSRRLKKRMFGET